MQFTWYYHILAYAYEYRSLQYCTVQYSTVHESWTTRFMNHDSHATYSSISGSGTVYHDMFAQASSALSWVLKFKSNYLGFWPDGCGFEIGYDAHVTYRFARRSSTNLTSCMGRGVRLWSLSWCCPGQALTVKVDDREIFGSRPAAHSMTCKFAWFQWVGVDVSAVVAPPG